MFFPVVISELSEWLQLLSGSVNHSQRRLVEPFPGAELLLKANLQCQLPSSEALADVLHNCRTDRGFLTFQFGLNVCTVLCWEFALLFFPPRGKSEITILVGWKLNFCSLFQFLYFVKSVCSTSKYFKIIYIKAWSTPQWYLHFYVPDVANIN